MEKKKKVFDLKSFVQLKTIMCYWENQPNRSDKSGQTHDDQQIRWNWSSRDSIEWGSVFHQAPLALLHKIKHKLTRFLILTSWAFSNTKLFLSR